MEEVLAETTSALLLMLVMNSSPAETVSACLHVTHNRIMLRQQDHMGKYFDTIFINKFESTGLMASVCFIFFKQETHPRVQCCLSPVQHQNS